MSDTATLTIKTGHTTRFNETAALNGAPANLTGKELRVVLKSGNTKVTLAVGTGMGITLATAGTYWWDVTAGNLTTLGDPATLTGYLTIFNSDNSIFLEDTFTLNVTD